MIIFHNIKHLQWNETLKYERLSLQVPSNSQRFDSPYPPSYFAECHNLEILVIF